MSKDKITQRLPKPSKVYFEGERIDEIYSKKYGVKTRSQLLRSLKKIPKEGDDKKENHIKADYLLLKHIGDDEIIKAFEAIDKYYV